MNTRPPLLTPAQLAKSLARKQKRQQLESAALVQPPRPSLLNARPWLSIPDAGLLSNPVKVLSWNLLAQCLVRRKLFPTSDCLKASQREPLIYEEILRNDAHILCLQEVDRLDKLIPVLEKAGYAHKYASGRQKLHGCLIAYKRDAFTLVDDHVVYYDEQRVPDADGRASRLGNTFKTRNIANIIALQRNNMPDQGIVVSTTHLFWHPKYTYERIRQLGIMIRETVSLRERNSATHWPCILAGDFNFTPDDVAYLLASHSSVSNCWQNFSSSLVIHSSVDPSQKTDAAVDLMESGDEAEDADPDRMITHARLARSEDGLLDASQIVSWFEMFPFLRSAYREALSNLKPYNASILSYGARLELSHGAPGFMEPEYTSYTHYWKNTIDYIFFIDGIKPARVTGILEPFKLEDLEPGIPRSQVSGSDHTVLVAELSW